MIANAPIYIAQNIQAGNSNAQSSVQTDIQGSGSVSTHIEVSANGQKKVLDSNSPGTFQLQVESHENNSSGGQTLTPTIYLSPTPIPTASPSPTIIPKKNYLRSSYYFANLLKNIHVFFDNIFKTLKFKNV